MTEVHVCSVCNKPDPDYYAESTNGPVYFHKDCVLTPEQTEALLRLQYKYQHLSEEDR